MTYKKKGIQKILAACMFLAGCSSSAVTDNSNETVLTSSKVDPLEETQTIEIGNIQVQIPADWEENENTTSDEFYSGEYNGIYMGISIGYGDGLVVDPVPKDEQETATEDLNEKANDQSDDSEGKIFDYAEIWECSDTEPVILEFTSHCDNYTPNPVIKNFKEYIVSYGGDSYFFCFASGDCESEDMEFWDEIIRNISYAELDDEASTAFETEEIEESSPVVIAVEPDPEEEEVEEEATQKVEIIESNPTTTTESIEDNESSEWNPEYTIGSIYYRPGKFAFVIADVHDNEIFQAGNDPDFVGYYSFMYIYIDYTKPEEISEEDVQFEQVLNTQHPDIPYVYNIEIATEYANNFYSTVPREPESFHVGIKNMDIHSAEGAIEMNVTFTKFDETVTFYLPQDYS